MRAARVPTRGTHQDGLTKASRQSAPKTSPSHRLCPPPRASASSPRSTPPGIISVRSPAVILPSSYGCHGISASLDQISARVCHAGYNSPGWLCRFVRSTKLSKLSLTADSRRNRRARLHNGRRTIAFHFGGRRVTRLFW